MTRYDRSVDADDLRTTAGEIRECAGLLNVLSLPSAVFAADVVTLIIIW